MIQRIQTVYLLFASVLMLLMLFFPWVKFLAGEELYTFYFNGVKVLKESHPEMVVQTWTLAVLTIVIALISFVMIFLYKKRALQMRLSIYNMILMVALVGLIFYYAFTVSQELNAITYYSFPVVFPVIAIVLTYLAFRSIRKDELLIKSYDRLR